MNVGFSPAGNVEADLQGRQHMELYRVYENGAKIRDGPGILTIDWIEPLEKKQFTLYGRIPVEQWKSLVTRH